MTGREGRAVRVRAGIAVVGAVALFTGGCASSARSEFGGGSVGAVSRALRHEGLEICGPPSRHAGFANQAHDSTVILVAEDCHDDAVTLVLDRFTNRTDRDAAARSVEGQVHPRVDGAVWTWRAFTIAALAGGATATMDRVTRALDRIGAR